LSFAKERWFAVTDSVVDIDHFDIVLHHISGQQGSSQQAEDITISVQVSRSSILKQGPPEFSLWQSLRIAQDPERTFGSGKTDIHTTDVIQKTDALGRGSYAGEDDNIALSSLESVSSVELDVFQYVLAMPADELRFEFFELAFIRRDDTNLASKVHLADIGNKTIVQLHGHIYLSHIH
jgi:hypothetical protein